MLLARFTMTVDTVFDRRKAAVLVTPLVEHCSHTVRAMGTPFGFARRAACNVAIGCCPIVAIALIGNLGGRGVGKGYLESAAEGAAPWLAAAAVFALVGSVLGELLARQGASRMVQRATAGVTCLMLGAVLAGPYAVLGVIVGLLIRTAEPSATEDESGVLGPRRSD